jgi:predicted MFS family arabinose efflux permease
METTLILIAVFAGYGIPIYIGVQAWRNGHREWVLALILATFGILGLMGIIVSSRNIEKGDTGVLLSVIAGVACLLAVYIIAWLKTRKLLAVPIECPKCGKPSKARKLVTLDKITGKKVQSRLIGTISLIFGIS